MKTSSRFHFSILWYILSNTWYLFSNRFWNITILRNSTRHEQEKKVFIFLFLFVVVIFPQENTRPKQVKWHEEEKYPISSQINKKHKKNRQQTYNQEEEKQNQKYFMYFSYSQSFYKLTWSQFQHNIL